jgi:adenylate kinase
MIKRLIILGAPGAGKGTQSRNLAFVFGLPHVSTGDMLRDSVKLDTDLGKSVYALIDAGYLVPDETVLGLVIQQISKGSYVLDGYPRKLEQAQTLEMITDKFGETVDAVVCLDVPDELIIERISGRLTCNGCNKMFHSAYHPPKEDGVCDKCGGKLETRQDDKTATVTNRLEIYHKLTQPIEDFYKERGILIKVNGACEKDELTIRIIAALREFDHARES